MDILKYFINLRPQNFNRELIMKRMIFNLLICALSALVIMSCEKETPVRPQRALDHYIELDFFSRYPGVSLTDFSEYEDSKDGKTVTGIHFVDGNGIQGFSVYKNGMWMITEKNYDVEDFLYAIPRKVARTYIGTGIENEVYHRGSDWYYVHEIARRGISKKQYEFLCTAPFDDGYDTAENLVYDIIIDEDGTLLTCAHDVFNPSIWWYDITTSMDAVRNKYPGATILGAVNDAGNNVLFVRDEGIVKIVTTKNRGDGFVWTSTSYPLDINTPLPESVMADKERYAEKHPDKPFYALSAVDLPEGHFYGLTFGSELNWTMFYSKAE